MDGFSADGYEVSFWGDENVQILIRNDYTTLSISENHWLVYYTGQLYGTWIIF
jgi:hypothetical protein